MTPEWSPSPHQESARDLVKQRDRSWLPPQLVPSLTSGALVIPTWWVNSSSFFFPEQSAVVRHHFAGLLCFTRVAIGPRTREFLDSVYGFLAQARRLACDACLAQPFDVGHSSIERINKLT